MNKKSIIVTILTIIAIIVVVVATNIIYFSISDYENNKLKQKSDNIQTKTQSMVQEQQNLTPAQNKLDSTQAQLMFLKQDKINVTAVNQNILYNMQKLLGGKTSGEVKIDVAKAQEFKTDINAYWKQNDRFSTNDGVKVGQEYASYMQTINNYLEGGIKTGYLNASDMPKFPQSDISPLTVKINNLQLQLIALKSEANPGSNSIYST